MPVVLQDLKEGGMENMAGQTLKFHILEVTPVRISFQQDFSADHEHGLGVIEVHLD